MRQHATRSRNGPESPPRSTLRRRERFSSRPFFLTLLVVSALCAFSLVLRRLGSHRAHGHTLVTRAVDNVFEGAEQDCHLVRKAADKCAFVKAHCSDEEAGILSYLTFYYCRLPNAQPFTFTVLILWLSLLFSTIGIAASDFFCINLSTIATLLGMSESLAGVTFLAFGNGSPDVFSTFAAMGSNSGSLAIGELIGAASFITAVVAGSMALVRPFPVARKSFVRDVGFFIIAASFTLIFLADSKLYLWESAAMVGFYLFYVAFVVTWHWWLGKRAKRRMTEAIARDHFAYPGNDIEPFEPYHDEEVEAPAQRRPAYSRATTATDLATLERSAAEWPEELIADDQEEARERWLGELSNNMRVSRPRAGTRHGTTNPIRPSLVGVLEFRAVLAGLQKSRNIQTIPINLRRYSDDPTFTTAQQADQLSTISAPPTRPAYEIAAEYGFQQASNGQYLDVKGATGNRARAVSVNDIDRLARGSKPQFDQPETVGHGEPSSKPADSQSRDFSGAGSSSAGGETVPPAAPLEASSLGPASIRPPQREGASQFLQLPTAGHPNHSPRLRAQQDDHTGHSELSQQHGEERRQRTLPGLQIPRSESVHSSPVSPFPPYTDDPTAMVISSRAPSFRLPPPRLSHDALNASGHLSQYDAPPKPLKWWPYHILPPPQELFSTLFPTLYNWQEKNIWERLLGIVSAPSIFLLTVTLPVVEVERKLEEEEHIPSLSLPGPGSIIVNGNADSRKSLITILEPDSRPSTPPTDQAGAISSVGAHGTTATVVLSPDDNVHHHRHTRHAETLPLLSPSQPRHLDSPEQLPSATSLPSGSSVAEPSGPKEWNRWLLIVQCFTSPLFTVVIVYSNFLSDDYGPALLLKMALYSQLVSCALLAVVLATSTPEQAPRWRSGLCFAGFVVSICWISTIANEVVGVLKWLGVALDMSDAILGLTIFAVGNSLGDFVADVTVARLGFPVMALSACFGGPMLNILLGIGLSGMYMSISMARGKAERHPDSPMRFKPFHVQVSGTLLISGATLLVTLCALLVAVPLRRWRMDRVVGGALIAMWLASTVANVAVELLGLGDNIG